MAMPQLVPDQFRFVLTATDAEPPTLKYALAAHADGSGHGCSICRVIAYYDVVGKQITIVLPPDVTLPARLELMVIDDRGQGYAPSADAVRALIFTRRARWCLPPAAPTPTALSVSYGFEQKGQMVSEQHPAPPPDGSFPPPAGP